MPAYGESFLSRILDDGTITPVKEFGITRDDFSSETERKVYDIIIDYAKHNANKTPDYRTVIEQVPDFYYREGVTDSYRFLTKELKSYAAKRRLVEMINGENGQPGVERIINEKDGNEAIEDLISRLESIKMRTSVRERVGTNLKEDKDKILEEYLRRQRGESYTVWKSWFQLLNRVMGGYVSSNVYVTYGRSGRGKSAITTAEAVNFAEQGANVLIWSMEMGGYEVLTRLFSIYSRIKGNVDTKVIDGKDTDIGFDSNDLRHGKLSEGMEEKFFDFVRNIDDLMPGNIIIRSVDDPDFTDRSLAALESDIIQTEADIVIVDPFYYLDYEPNTSKKTGGDAENTSKKLRRIAGSTETVIIAITQAEEISEEEDEDGNRELQLPQRKEVKKTTQLLEDAAVLIAIDTNYKEGRGLIGINKGRDGGEGEEAEIIYLPQYGIIEELTVDPSGIY